MIYLGKIVKLEDTKVWAELPDIGVGFKCLVRVNPDETYVVGDQVACSQINGAKEEFYVMGRISSTSTITLKYTPIQSADNLNNYKTDGSYVANTDAIAATVVNIPETKQGILQVYNSVTQTWVIQRYMVYSPGSGTGNLYSRGFNGTTWSPWRRTITSVDTFGPSGVFGTLDTALTTLDTRLDLLEPRVTTAEGTIVSHTSTIGSHTSTLSSHTGSISTLNSKTNALENADIALDLRLDEWEAWQAATKKWSIVLSGNWLTTGTSLADITGLTVTIPTVANGEYAIFLKLCVELTGSATPTAVFEGTMSLNGSDQTERLLYRPGGSAANSASNRQTITGVYFYDSATTGNKTFKARGLSDSTVYRVYEIHSSIKVIRLK